MGQQDKELLLKDLNARLLYKTKYQIEVFSVKTSKSVQTVGILCSIEKIMNYYRAEFEYQHEFHNRIETRHNKIIIGSQLLIKPYLRPMSSMTEEEEEEYESIKCWKNEWELVDWLNAHHFDYRGLIEKGLALEAPKGMYKID